VEFDLSRVALGVVAVSWLAGGVAARDQTPSAVANPARCRALTALPRDAAVERQLVVRLAKISTDNKVGQLLQVAFASIKPADVETYMIKLA
jgi:hypothetical protein